MCRHTAKHQHDLYSMTSIFQYSNIHYTECSWATSREMVNINNSAFLYLPHIIAFYIQRKLETEMVIESSGLASCKHKTMSIHSLRLWLEIISNAPHEAIHFIHILHDASTPVHYKSNQRSAPLTGLFFSQR